MKYGDVENEVWGYVGTEHKEQHSFRWFVVLLVVGLLAGCWNGG